MKPLKSLLVERRLKEEDMFKQACLMEADNDTIEETLALLQALYELHSDYAKGKVEMPPEQHNELAERIGDFLGINHKRRVAEY